MKKSRNARIIFKMPRREMGPLHPILDEVKNEKAKTTDITHGIQAKTRVHKANGNHQGTDPGGPPQ